MLIRKVARKLQDVGIYGTLKLVLLNVVLPFKPSHRQFVKNFKEEQDFERRYGIDTIDVIEVSDIDVGHDERAHIRRYEPTRIDIFNTVLNNLPISYKEFVFIDVGSGKGRTLLLASNFPFKKIIGIELSPHINRIARNNIAKYQSDSQKCLDIESICCDASVFLIPDEQAVFYFYNPFDEHVLHQVLSNIEISIARWPREIYLVYANPVYGKLMDNARFLKVVEKREAYYMYTNES